MIVLVTGGASCGKSAFAEQVACTFPQPRYYLAAMKPFGEEGARRIARHRALRAGKGFLTVECFEGLDQVDLLRLEQAEAEEGVQTYACGGSARRAAIKSVSETSGESVSVTSGGSDSCRNNLLGARSFTHSEGATEHERTECGHAEGISAPMDLQPCQTPDPLRIPEERIGELRRERARCSWKGRTALLESLGNVVANELFRDDGTCASYDEALAAVIAGVEHLACLFDNIVVVGDEVGGDGLRYDETTEIYIHLIGAASCAIAAMSDVVFECVAGQPFCIKNATDSQLFKRTRERS